MDLKPRKSQHDPFLIPKKLWLFEQCCLKVLLRAWKRKSRTKIHFALTFTKTALILKTNDSAPKQRNACPMMTLSERPPKM